MEEKTSMKKEYVKPEARKMDFDYEENVVASGEPTRDPAWWWCKTCRPDLF